MNHGKPYSESGSNRRLHPGLRLRFFLPALFMLTLCVAGYGQGRDPEIEIETSPAEIPASIAPESPLPPAAADAQPAAVDAPPVVPPAESQMVNPEIIMSAGILVDGLQFDMEMPWGHEEFENYRATYMTSGGKKWLLAVMERSLPYLAYVEEKILEYKLPKELLYLPVIESEYSPFAVSRSGATGIWQFMRNSISGYGLSISEWTDDRKDFMKSTDAALQKLRDNYEALGDWPLAIAAYNAGLGAVSRAIKSSNGESIDFWHLYDSKKLSREPLSYVPKFLAVASILSYPELHGFQSDWGEKRLWEALETSRQVDMNVLAERTGIPLKLLKDGNAELKYHITPPSSKHMVKVPADKAETVRAVLEDVSSPLFKYEIYKIKSGDTMSAIAQRYATPLNIILQANPGLKADKIKIGQTVIIPHLSATISASKKTTGSDNTAFSDFYTIKKGDTLSGISLLFNVKPDTLAEQNGISVNSTLRIGQKLKVPAR